MNISGLRLPACQTGAAAGAKRGSFDLPFFVLTLLLLAIGVIMVLSSSFARAYAQGKSPTYYFVRQAGFAVAGVVGMILFSHVRMATYRRWSLALLGVSIFLLAIVWIPHIGVVGGGARRWLSLGFTTFQPSEIAKLGVILYFADSISKKKDKMRTLRYGILPYGFILALIAVLMYFEPHLSGTVLILGIGAAMMFVGGIRGYWVGIGIGGRSRHQFDQRHIQFLAQLDDGTRCRKLIDTHVVATNADTRVGGDTRNIHLGPFRLAQFRHRNVILCASDIFLCRRIVRTSVERYRTARLVLFHIDARIAGNRWRYKHISDCSLIPGSVTNGL